MDSQIKRDLLQKLMDLMDEHTRTDMKSSISQDPQDENQPQTELDQHDSTNVDDIVNGEHSNDDEDTNVIDPIVMLAKRFKK